MVELTRVQKIEVFPLGSDEEKNAFYKFFNEESKKYVKALNKIYSHLYMEHIFINDLSSLDQGYQERLETINSKIEDLRSSSSSTAAAKIEKEYQKINKLRNQQNAKSRKLFDESIGLLSSTRTRDLGKQFNFGFSDFLDSANQKAKQDFNSDFTDLILGNRSARVYRHTNQTASLPFRGRDIRFFEKDGIYSVHLPLGINLGINFGKNTKPRILAKKTIKDILNNEIKLSQSRLVRNGKKMYLHLIIQFEKETENIELIPDLTLTISYTDIASGTGQIKNKDALQFGHSDYIEDFKKKMSILRSKEQAKAVYSTGSHGRQRKLSTDRWEAIRTRESNFVKTYNNQISRKIVDFALKNKCAKINIISPSTEISKKSWAYYQLHEMIDQKAARSSIIVDVINNHE